MGSPLRRSYSPQWQSVKPIGRRGDLVAANEVEAEVTTALDPTRIITVSLTLGPAAIGLPLTLEEIVTVVPRLVLAFQRLGIIPTSTVPGLTISMPEKS